MIGAPGPKQKWGPFQAKKPHIYVHTVFDARVPNAT